MKRGLIILVSLFMISLATAVPVVTFQYNETQVGETILGEISTTGEFTKQLDSSDIQFLEGRKNVFLESDIMLYNNTYYFYIYTTRTGDFTMKIPGILYKEAGELKSTTIEHQLVVSSATMNSENKTEVISIKPGFIELTDKLELRLVNKGTSPLSITYSDQDVSLSSEELIKLNITQKDGFSFTKVQTYKGFSIPVITSIWVIENQTENITEGPGLKVSPESFLLELISGNESTIILEIFNLGEKNFTKIEYDHNISFLEITKIEEIGAREVHNLSITLSPEFSGHIEENITITYGEDRRIEIPLSIFALPAGSTEEDFVVSEETCEDKSGQACTASQDCNGAATFTAGQVYCCIGTCVEKPKKNEGGGFGWVMGIIIIGLLGYGGYYLYKKQKEVAPKKPQEKLKETSEKYSKRISGSLQKG